MSQPQPDDAMRVGTTEREAAAQRVNEAFEQGRLTLAEHDERLTACFDAVTRADLRAVLADLPGPDPIDADPGNADAQLVGGELAPRPQPARPVSQRSTQEMLRAIWTPWAGVAVLVTVIWLLSGIGGDLGYFWPAWVIGPWGVVNVMATLGIWGSRGKD